MISLFNIPQPVIDYSKFDHVLHGKVVTEFEEAFVRRVGYKYGVGVCSCTMAITLTMQFSNIIRIPVVIPPVVVNAVIHSGKEFMLVDDPYWVGGSYMISENICDSAQEVLGHDCEISLYSFYPTKPVAGIDGGMICTNNESIAETMRTTVMNGSEGSSNSWGKDWKSYGWKAYMSSAQAYVAYESLKRFDERNEVVGRIRDKYNSAFGLDRDSQHLYRVKVRDAKESVRVLGEQGISTGIHYNKITDYEIYKHYRNNGYMFSRKLKNKMLTIPMHEGLSEKDTDKIVTEVKKCL